MAPRELLGAHLGLLDPTRVSRIVLEVATLSLPTNRLKVRRSMVSNFEKPALTRWLAAAEVLKTGGRGGSMHSHNLQRRALS